MASSRDEMIAHLIEYIDFAGGHLIALDRLFEEGAIPEEVYNNEKARTVAEVELCGATLEALMRGK